MVCLNDKLPIDFLKMKKILISELDSVIEDELYYIDDMKKENKKKIKINIVKNFKEKINMNHFVYMIIHKNHCTYKHTRGKKDGEFCCKKITKHGDINEYVCTTHNKNHIPTPRQNLKTKDKTLLYNKKEELINSITKDIELKYSTEFRSLNKTIEEFKIDIKKKEDIVDNLNLEINVLKKYKNKTENKDLNIKINEKDEKKIFFEVKKKLNKDILINNYNKNKRNGFSNYKNTNNIICKYNGKKKCYNIEKHGKCDYKHNNNNFLLNDLNKNINPIISY